MKWICWGSVWCSIEREIMKVMVVFAGQIGVDFRRVFSGYRQSLVEFWLCQKTSWNRCHCCCQLGFCCGLKLEVCIWKINSTWQKLKWDSGEFWFWTEIGGLWLIESIPWRWVLTHFCSWLNNGCRLVGKNCRHKWRRLELQSHWWLC